MLDTYIRQISHNFIQEAKHSPMLLEDMAAMEKYMAESYSNRAFVELWQNADDAGATSVFITMTGKDLIVANNGRPLMKRTLMQLVVLDQVEKNVGKL